MFVFGGTTGINFGIAAAFARRGASVSIASRKHENVDAAVQQLSAPVNSAFADVRDFDAVDDAAREFGPIDVLISGFAFIGTVKLLGRSRQHSPDGGAKKPFKLSDVGKQSPNLRRFDANVHSPLICYQSY